ncbi:MAG: hypothetical protein BWX72_01582 [Firmicutes bacterium ADurb.Bin080]|nr:MAG: hypothetical protein BWX72_01582 [Firmicutes bacterium ADurb.Bin080]
MCPNCLYKLESKDKEYKKKKNEKETEKIFIPHNYIIGATILFLIVIIFGLANVIAIDYPTTETYIEKEPYNVTETYTEKEPYTVKEAYQDTEVYYEKEACGTTRGPTGTYEKNPDGTMTLRIGTGTVTKYCDVPKTRTVTNYRDVVKYRDVNKTRTVVEYRDVEKTRTVTKKAKIWDILFGNV